MPNAKPWTADDMPDLSGETIIVTGGNSGIGYEAALQFARKKAHTILACRSLAAALIGWGVSASMISSGSAATPEQLTKVHYSFK